MLNTSASQNKCVKNSQISQTGQTGHTEQTSALQNKCIKNSQTSQFKQTGPTGETSALQNKCVKNSQNSQTGQNSQNSQNSLKVLLNTSASQKNVSKKTFAKKHFLLLWKT